MAKENTYYWPKKNATQSFQFPALNGGLNLRDAEINLKDNESPEIVNLWWSDGVLRSRPGQELAASGWGDGEQSGESFEAIDTVYASTPFQEGILVHIGASFYTVHGDFHEFRRVSGTEDFTSVPRNTGTFFRFGEDLYYKNAGGFYRFQYKAHAQNASPLTVSKVTDEAFTPTILINANPATGSGDLYQPENRLSPKKRVTYNASVTESMVRKTGNGVTRAFFMGVTSAGNLNDVASVYIDDAYIEPALYSFNARTGTIIFDTAPSKNAVITFNLSVRDNEYHLPVDRIEAVTEVKLWSNGHKTTLSAGKDYTVDLSTGIVTFTTVPPVTNPPTNNTVEITYSKANPDALNAVMNCPYAGVCGTGKDLCVVCGGGSNQENAFFWSGNTEYGLDMTYWPIDQYNFSVTTITGFGEQYDQMFVFQRDRIGKLNMNVEAVNERNVISLTYEGVNDRIGCDLPQSVQLIENNLTFANTSGGVYRILSSSAAYENNVQRISDKINGSTVRPGLLYDFRVAGNGDVVSMDDGKRYWLAVNGHIWLWEYSISAESDPVWFYFTGLSPLSMSIRNDVVFVFDAQNRAAKLSEEIYDDFETPIRKVYQFPVRNFGGYDRLKDVRTVIFSLGADTPSEISVVYQTDYETREDRIDLAVSGNDRLTNRDLTIRDLSAQRYAATFRREPHCNHVRHFSMRLESEAQGKTIALYSAEILMRYSGRDR